MSRLFTSEFLLAASQLRIVARQVPGGGRHAEHRSKAFGSGLEFLDFRSYVAGDDLRRIDWNVYRRSGRLLVRMFEAPQDLPVHVLLDLSDSMFFEDPPRADVARQMAGLIIAIAAGQADRVALWPLGAQLSPPRRVGSGKSGLHAALAEIEQLGPAGGTDLVGALRQFAGMPHRAGLAVLISDFFDPQGVAAVIDALRPLRHRLLFVQVGKASDADPGLRGEVAVVDCETQAVVELTVTDAVARQVRAAHAEFCKTLLAFAAKRGAAHLRLDADAPLLDQIQTLFPDRVLVA